MKKGHLTYTVFFTIMAASLLPLFVFGFYITSVNKSLLKNEFNEKLKYYNARLSNDVSVFIAKNQVLADTFLTVHAMHDSTAITPAHQDINEFLNSSKGITSMAFLDSSGFEIASFGPRPKMDYSDNLPLIITTSIENRQLFIGTIKKNPIRKTLALTLAFPAKEGVVGLEKGALVAEFNMKPLETDLNEDLQDNYLALIFTKSGFLIYSSDKGLSTTLTNPYKDKISALAAQAKDGESVKINDRKYTGILTVNPVTGWIIYTEQPSSMIEGVIWTSAKSSFKSILAVFGAIFLFALFSSFYIAGLIIRPIKSMTQAVKMVEEGKINELPSMSIPDNELGVLVIAFGRMLDSIKLKFESLAQDQHDLEELNQSLEIRVGSRTKELRTALNELIKKERLAAIGQMASIVSHEIKNPLAVMANSIYLIKARMGENADPRVLKNISVIEQEIKQANGIIEEILGYARSREQIFTVIDLSLYMREILSSFPMPQNVQVSCEFYPQPLPVRIDTEEMKQALRNVINNSIEVMPEGGQLIIKTKFEHEQALLSIRDTGPGIPKDIQEKIFAPFFTTKARGTGLGLAVVKKVAARNNAEILLQSEEGKGTQTTMIFNLFKEAA